MGTSRWTNLGPPISYEPGSTDVKQMQNYITIIAGIVMCVHTLYVSLRTCSSSSNGSTHVRILLFGCAPCRNVTISRLSGVRHTATATLKSLFVLYMCIIYVCSTIYLEDGLYVQPIVSCSNAFRHNII